MKCIEDEIPFEVPEGWAWNRLGNISTIARGGSPRPIKAFITTESNGINWIKIGDTEKDGKYIFSTKEKIKPEGASKSRYVQSGDFLLTNSMSFGRPYILKTDGCIHDGWLVIGNIELVFNQDYLYYALSADFMYKTLAVLAAGSTVDNLNSDLVKSVLFPIPPMNEQTAIAYKVDDLLEHTEMIALKEDNIGSTVKQIKTKILDLAIRGSLVPQDSDDEPASVLLERMRAEKEELIKQGKIRRDKNASIIFKGDDNSYYERMKDGTINCIDEEIPFKIPVSWEWCRLKELSAPENNSFVDGPFGSNLKREHYTDKPEVRIIQLNNIGNLEWKDDIKRYTTFLHAQTLERCRTIPGDIVIAKMMPAGRAVIVPSVHDDFVISSDNIRLRLSKHITTKYVYYMINSPSINKIISDTVQGVGRTRTSLGKLREIICPLPPFKEQKRIVDIIEKCISNLDGITVI